MKSNKFIISAFCALGVFGLQSCLDYDNPTDEFSSTEVTTDDVIYHGNADEINYTKSITADGVKTALADLKTTLRQAQGGQFAMRGGKEGGAPVSHAYQRQFTLGPDNYAQMAIVPHYDFMYGTLDHIYAVSKEFNPGPNSSYIIAKNAFVPVLNHPQVDSIPEIKALYLLLFNMASQEVSDLHGPFPYVDFKNNKVDAPFTYNDLRTVYVNIEANVDTVINCLNYFKTKPQDYQTQIKKAMTTYFSDLSDVANDMDVWVRAANSLKLRMAMHIVKVDPALAKKWAEEAVAGGVTESPMQEIAFRPFITGFSHPLSEISESWADTRMSASLECLLMSLKHPYAEYLFKKNSNPILNKTTGEVTPANTRVVGMREGVAPGQGQTVGTNVYAAYSRIDAEVLGSKGVPLYLVKMSEVDFLRAEGALRGWNMGGTAKFFYERGIDNAYLEDRSTGDNPYTDGLAEYKNVENPVAYVYRDPQGIVEDAPSVTKIGVKWNEGDSKEVKLEKIITQKYIAAYPFSFEAWVDLRRTGYPKVLPVLNPENGDGSLSFGDIIRRMPFPNSDDASIQDIQTTGLKALGGDDKQATRLWWDVDAANF